MTKRNVEILGFGITFFQIVLVLRDSLYLNIHNGPTFRDAFARAIRLTQCRDLSLNDCCRCSDRNRCLYFFFFEKKHPRGFYPVRPYVLEVPFGKRKRINAGEELKFNLILMGDTSSRTSDVVEAVQAMGRTGLGPARAKFSVEGIYYLKQGSLSRVNLSEGVDVPSINHSHRWPEFFKYKDAVRLVKVRLLTPVRFKKGGNLLNRLEFHTLVTKLLKRIIDLDLECSGGNLKIGVEELAEASRDVRMVEELSRWYWYDCKEYSESQEDHIYLGGIVGEIVYEGDITPFIPYLRVAEYIHVGKQTTLGNGLISVEVA